MTASLTKYLGIIRITIRERLQLRFDFLMSLLSSLMFALLYYMLWNAIYAFTPHPVMPWAQLITYVMIGQAINFSRLSTAERVLLYKMMWQIQSGDIALDLIKPVGFQLRRFLESISFFAVEFLWVSIPLLILAITVLRVHPPPTPLAGIYFAISLLIGFIFGFALNSIIIMLAFWTTNMFGTQMAKKALIEICSGVLIPFEFLPIWLKNIVIHLPFQGMAYIPLSIYIGKIRGIPVYYAILSQIGWVVIALVFSRILWKAAEKRISIYGG